MEEEAFANALKIIGSTLRPVLTILVSGSGFICSPWVCDAPFRHPSYRISGSSEPAISVIRAFDGFLGLFGERGMTLVREDHFVPVVNAVRVQVVGVEECQIDIFSVGTFLRYSL